MGVQIVFIKNLSPKKQWQKSALKRLISGSTYVEEPLTSQWLTCQRSSYMMKGNGIVVYSHESSDSSFILL